MTTERPLTRSLDARDTLQEAIGRLQTTLSRMRVIGDHRTADDLYGTLETLRTTQEAMRDVTAFLLTRGATDGRR